MTGSDDLQGDMTPAPHALDDPTVERLLHRASLDGSAVPADLPAELEPVARVLAAVADLGDVPVQPRGALADLLADGFAPAPAAAPAVPLRSRLARLRRPAARLAGVGLVAQVLTGTGVAVASVTAAAGAGVLPASLQQPVGQVLNVVTPFTFPTVPAGVQSTEEPEGTVAPAVEESQATQEATTSEPVVQTATTSGATPTAEATEATAEPTATTSSSGSPASASASTSTAEPSETASTSPTTSPTPTDEPSASPSTTPTTSPTPTSEPTPTGSSRPTRQNEKPGKGEETEPPLDDPALVAFD